MVTKQKVHFAPDKDTWHPSVLPGQIVVVSTVNAQGRPNLAPKSWITMAAFAGPMLAFGCNTGHTTCQNIQATGTFVINIPAEQDVERTWALIRTSGEERIQQSGFTLIPSQMVAPPLVAECRAHLECEFDSLKQFGDEVLVFGRVVAASIDANCLAGEPVQQYCALRPIFFLEDGTYGAIETAKQIGREWPADHRLFVVQLGALPEEDLALVHAHVAFLQTLRHSGQLVAGGPFADEPGVGGWSGTLSPGEDSGLYILNIASPAEAEELARQDPLVQAGASCRVRPWMRTF